MERVLKTTNTGYIAAEPAVMFLNGNFWGVYTTVSYTHLRAHETVLDLVCRLLLENKKETQ